MTWYDVDLGKEGVAQLDASFRDYPFCIERLPKISHATVCVEIDGRRLELFSYDERKIITYHLPIERMPEGIQLKIFSELSKVGALERLFKRK